MSGSTENETFTLILILFWSIIFQIGHENTGLAMNRCSAFFAPTEREITSLIYHRSFEARISAIAAA